jgi:hypothetical protein
MFIIYKFTLTIKIRDEMECLTSKETIDSTFEMVSDASFSEKQSKIPTEEEVNNFLDKVLGLQNLLNKKSEKIGEVNEKLETITWLNNIDENSLRQINILIGVAKDLHSVLVRQFINLNILRKKGIAKDAIKKFKSTIDNLKDIIADLESAFFSLPQIPGFVETTKELSLL